MLSFNEIAKIFHRIILLVWGSRRAPTAADSVFEHAVQQEQDEEHDAGDGEEDHQLDRHLPRLPRTR